MRGPRGGRALAPAEQLKVLSRVWRNDRDGYVFLPWISGDSNTPAQRRKNYHEGRAFEWPRERDAILAHLQAHQEDDLYFCPNLFNGKRRQEELVYAEMCLYADLDEVDPRRVRPDRRPTIAWESSPGRFQGVWLLGGMREGATWPGGENQRLTYELGADLSGWDSTQLLRVPGKPNYKHEYREKNRGQPAPGKLLWDAGPRYAWGDFDDLPEIGVLGGEDADLVDEEFLRSVDRHAVVARVKNRISRRAKNHLAARSAADAEGADRSDVLWEIERELADAGCTLAEIVAVVRPTAWNKYRGRNDELRRLKTEAAKALAEARESDSAISFEEPKPQALTSMREFFAEEVPRPRWLVRGVWTEGACGFIAGEPKSYKSWIALDLAVSLATGSPFLGAFPVVGGPHRVLYLQEEDSRSLVRDRLSTVIDGKAPRLHPDGAMGMAGGRPTWGPPERDAPLYPLVRKGFVASEEGWHEWLDEKLERDGFKVVVVDTLFTTAGSVDVDKSSELMSRILKPLKDVAGRHDAAVVVVHHNKKNGGGHDARAGKDMLGGVALHAWVDCALYVRSRTDVDRVLGLSLEVPGGDGAGTSGNVSYLGVPGTELLVEREAKAAEEIRFKLSVPRMVRHTGNRWPGDGEALAAADRWMPQVTMGWRREREGDDDGEEKTGGKKKPGTARSGKTTPWERRDKRPAGRLIVERMAEMGITSTRGKTVEEIAEILDVAVRGVRVQLKAAAAAGWATKRDDGTWLLAGNERNDD